MTNTKAWAASSGQLPVTSTTTRTSDVAAAAKRWPRGSTCIADAPDGEGVVRTRGGGENADSVPQAWGHSAVATRQKSTARRFVSSCSVQLRTSTMLGARSLAVIFLTHPEIAFGAFGMGPPGRARC